MLRRNSELSAYVLLAKLFQEFIIAVRHHIIESYSRSDKYFFHTRNRFQLPQKLNIILVVNLQIPARFREQTLLVGAYTIFILLCT